MIKFRDIGVYKNAVNVPYCVTDVELKNGMVVTADLADKTVALPTGVVGKNEAYIVMNRIDKPEVATPDDYTIEVGENPRLFLVQSLNTRILDMNMLSVTGAYASINVGDVLVAGNDGKLVVGTASGQEVYFEVIEKTSFGGNGLAVQVIVA